MFVRIFQATLICLLLLLCQGLLGSEAIRDTIKIEQDRVGKIIGERFGKYSGLSFNRNGSIRAIDYIKLKNPPTCISDALKMADSLFTALSDLTHVDMSQVDSIECRESEFTTRYVVEYVQKPPFSGVGFIGRPSFAFEFYTYNSCSILNRFIHYPDFTKIQLISQEQAVKIALDIQKEPRDSTEKFDFTNYKFYWVKSPESKLTYINFGNKYGRDSESAVLCWQIMYSNGTGMFIDAITGEVVPIDPIVSPIH